MSMKKKITQNDLRKAMHEHKKKLVGVKRIESPLAKYTETGQLMCILCQSIVRSESAWPVHLVSSKHKENVELARKTKLETFQVPKRPASPIEQVSSKKTKVQSQLAHDQGMKGVPDDFFDKPPKTKTIPAHSLAEKSEDVEMEQVAETTSKIEEVRKEKDSALPEGFFDDPKLDAKVRNVEYKNPLDDEWERFEKEMKEEAAQSAQIIEEDQEEATAERELAEIDEQIHKWSRVMHFESKLKESAQRKEKKHDLSKDNDSSSDETEYDEEMDWRAKKSVK